MRSGRATPARAPANTVAVYREIELVPPKDWADIRFVFESTDAEKEPKALERIRQDYEETATVINSQFPGTEYQKERYDLLGELHAAASILLGTGWSVQKGRTNLAAVRGRLVKAAYDKSSRDRGAYGRYLIVAGAALVIGGLLYFGSQRGWLNLPKPTTDGVFDPLVAGAIAVMWIPAGVVLGLFLEGLINPESITYAQLLRAARPGYLGPYQRVLKAIAVSFVYAVLVGVRAVQVGTFGIFLGDFATTRPYCSLLIGVLGGWSSPTIMNVIRKLMPRRARR